MNISWDQVDSIVKDLARKTKILKPTFIGLEHAGYIPAMLMYNAVKGSSYYLARAGDEIADLNNNNTSVLCLICPVWDRRINAEYHHIRKILKNRILYSAGLVCDSMLKPHYAGIVYENIPSVRFPWEYRIGNNNKP